MADCSNYGIWLILLTRQCLDLLVIFYTEKLSTYTINNVNTPCHFKEY